MSKAASVSSSIRLSRKRSCKPMKSGLVRTGRAMSVSVPRPAGAEIGTRRAVKETRRDIDRNRLARRDRGSGRRELDLEPLRHEILNVELDVAHRVALGVEVGIHLPAAMRSGLGQGEVVVLGAHGL